MQGYREHLRLALVVPVRAAAGDDEAALLARHRFNVAQARALGELGAEVQLFVDAPFSVVRPIGARAAIHFVRGLGAPAGPRLISAALAARPDAIHLFHLLDVKTLALAAALAGRRLFAEYNGGAVPEGALRRRVMRGATSCGLFFTARAIAEPFVARGAIASSARIHAVPELSSLLSFARVPAREEARARLGVAPGELLLLCAGRLAAEKDPFTAVEAFLEVRRARPGARLIFAALADELGSQFQAPAGVEIRRAVPHGEMPYLYAAADVMLHPSRRETCGAAFVEALQAGLPIAGSDIPAFRALAGDSSAVKLCAPGDARAFAEAALALAGDPSLRERARARFERALSFSAIASRKLRIYSGEPVPEVY